MNPYYHPEQLGLELLSFDEPNLSYEYNILCFWATKEGEVYTAQNSGCSCPTPFEDNHDRETREEVIATLERVGSLAQAQAVFDAWNRSYDGTRYLGGSERAKLTRWINRHLKA